MAATRKKATARKLLTKTLQRRATPTATPYQQPTAPVPLFPVRAHPESAPYRPYAG